MKIKIELTDQDGKEKVLEVEYDSSKTVLEHIEAAGATSPYGCRVGSCGTCIASVVSGQEFLEDKDVIEENTCSRVSPEDGEARLPCRIHFKESSLTENSTVRIEKIKIV